MTEHEFWQYVGSIGARLYDPDVLRAVLIVAGWIRKGETFAKEDLPWPLV